jgi:hypothetical protein
MSDDSQVVGAFENALYYTALQEAEDNARLEVALRRVREVVQEFCIEEDCKECLNCTIANDHRVVEELRDTGHFLVQARTLASFLATEGYAYRRLTGGHSFTVPRSVDHTEHVHVNFVDIDSEGMARPSDCVHTLEDPLSECHSPNHNPSGTTRNKPPSGWLSADLHFGNSWGRRLHF